MGLAAIVLAGGEARRMGGVLKPLLPVGGVPMLRRVMTAARAAGADPIVVVGPSELDVYIGPGEETGGRAYRTQEEPPGGGPVAGIRAGLALCRDADEIAILGGDLPFLTGEAITALRGAKASVYTDERRQPMVTVWRTAELQSALAGQPRSMMALLDAVPPIEVRWAGVGPPPWYDCDTPQALEEAQRWWR